MKITIEGTDYELDVQAALGANVLTEVREPQPGEVWLFEQDVCIVMPNNSYETLQSLAKHEGYFPTQISKLWRKKFLAKDVIEYVRNRYV